MTGKQHRLGAAAAAWVLLLALAGCEQTTDYRPLQAGTTVLAFGDSVTHGTGAGPGEDYPSQLAAATGWRVVNAGIPGDTAREAKSRLGPLLERHDPALVIVELGGNDFLRKRPASSVRADLEAMLLESQRYGAATVLVSVPRLSLLRASVGALSDSPIYRELAEKTGVILVEDLFSDILSEDDLRADKIHPNARGYARLADGILERLRAVGLAH